MHIERANAKINVYLNILSRQENGYHELVSILQTISLCDLVTVDYQPAPQSRVTLTVSGNTELPADCRNLAFRAAERFLQHTHLCGAVRIMLQKHIPAAAGLGGGSADAAAVLRALNCLCGEPLSTDELCELGLTLGADVPFCIRGGAMLATGVGERLERIADMPFAFLVIAIGEKAISTPAAYAALDEKYNFYQQPLIDDKTAETIARLWENQELDDSCAHFFNVFEQVVPKDNTEVETIQRILRESGAIRAMMSGSGPSVFGVFETQSGAEKACETLQQKGMKAFVCHPRGQYID